MANNIEKPLMFFTFILSFSLTMAKPSTTRNQNCRGPAFTPTTIRIKNDIGKGQILSFFCHPPSEDYTGSGHVVSYNQTFALPVKPVVANGSTILTKYLCWVTWIPYSVSGATFYDERVDVQRCCGDVKWVANRFSIVGLSTHASLTPPRMYGWSK